MAEFAGSWSEGKKMKRATSRPLLAVVAVLALVLGSVGTAAAGPALTKSKVKKIATKVVTRAAPGLSVAHASTADNATTLGGLSATTYLDRFAQTTSTTSTSIPTGSNTQILGPVSITVPAGVGFVRVSAVSGFATGSSNIAMWFQVDNVCVGSGNDFNNRQFGNTTNNQDSISVDRVVPVTAGVHTFRLCMANAATVNADNRVLMVETVALAG